MGRSMRPTLPNLTVTSFREFLNNSIQNGTSDPCRRIALRILKINPPLFEDTIRGPVIRHKKATYCTDNFSALIFALAEKLEPLIDYKSQEAHYSRIIAQYDLAIKGINKLFRLCRAIDSSLRIERHRKILAELREWRERAKKNFCELALLNSQKQKVKETARHLVEDYIHYTSKAPTQVSANLIAAHVISLLTAFRLPNIPANSTLRRIIASLRSR
jgi:hypothetical protein